MEVAVPGIIVIISESIIMRHDDDAMACLRVRNLIGLLLYVNDSIPSKLVFKSAADDESLFVEIYLYKKKYLIGATYNPCKTSISKHLNSLGMMISISLPNSDNVILMGDFNCDPVDLEVIEFCESSNLKKLTHEPTCFKSLTNRTCIDLILTNRKRSFQNTCIVETGLSDFHKMMLTVLKTFFKKSPPKFIFYRDYKNYSNEGFRKELDFILQNYKLFNMSNDDFNILLMKIFDKHAPLKKKYVRANEGPFITKELRKEIMKRTKLFNIYSRDKSFISRKHVGDKETSVQDFVKETKGITTVIPIHLVLLVIKSSGSR